MATILGTIGTTRPSTGLVVAKIVDVNGTNGADILHGTADHNIMRGFDGDDQIFGHEGDDLLIGGNGADFIDGGTGTFDTVFYADSNVGVTVDLALGFGRHGTAEGDTLVNVDDIIGSKHRDTLIGNDGSNRLMGEEGDDVLMGGFGADALFGADGGGDVNAPAGIDTAVYSDSPVGVTVNLQTGRGFGGTAEGDTLFSIEQIQGSVHNDVLTGNDVVNFLQGSRGDDILKGAGGDDILHGAGDNDTLKGGGGADVLEGGIGIDTAAYNESEAGVFVSLISNTADFGDAEGDQLFNIENLTGSAHADDLWGNDSANALRGMSGNDTLKGFGGADSLNGDDGNDSLFGDAGFDTLRGGNGADVLVGGAGQDTMFGGAGADTFKIKALSDAPAAGFLFTDYMPDFSSAQGDKLDLSALDANTGVAGNQAFIFIGNEAVFSGVAGQLRFTTGFVEGDVNGDRAADFQIELDVLSVSSSDFVL